MRSIKQEEKKEEMAKIDEIANGWKNVIKSKLGVSSEEDEKIFQSRRAICNECDSRSELDRCLECGCPLAAKTRSLISDCPLGRWIV